ncbi:hypothetical protein Hanom_Chr04g00327091 [Helianthus anomalus]
MIDSVPGNFGNFKFQTITFTTPLIFISADTDHRCFNQTIPNQVTWVPLHGH